MHTTLTYYFDIPYILWHSIHTCHAQTKIRTLLTDSLMHLSALIGTHTHIHTQVHKRTHTHSHTHIYTQTHTHTQTHTQTHTRAHTLT